MIQTAQGYKQTLKWIKEFKEVAESLKKELSHNPKLLKIELDGIESQIADLQKQALQFEQNFLNTKKVA